MFRKYWHPVFKDWHENIIGVYHISAIGCNHQDLNYNEHSGPCLRQTFWEYVDPLPDSDETTGNFEEGNDHHKLLEGIIKKWKPNTIIEKPMSKLFTRDGITILITGSVDVEYQHLFDLDKDDSKTKKKISIWDIKTASSYTMPKNKDDMNPTHFDQISNYATFNYMYEINTETKEISRLKMIYVDKRNKKTIIQHMEFDIDIGVELLSDLVDRAFALHECLENNVVPIPEPMKWCKYCKYLSRCIDQDDVELIYVGKYLKGLKVKDV